ncbi:hypothetical protein SE17_23685 [Kouleothrix aurantiaca]|uniref:DUF5681 domain-containing protein n=1 Tax=Kouleothrix aurantiaca TaxID=186479 RepID=A0A0P9CZB9_9CHLR|nr:hypothetical protein SE17_23685 [Kouleothrix aurantiaca]
MARFVKGESGNPRGRAPRLVENAQRSVLLEMFDENAERRVIRGMIEAAADGDVGAFKALYERKYGKVKDIEPEKNEVTVTVEYAE